jgi:hypothetical protein
MLICDCILLGALAISHFSVRLENVCIGTKTENSCQRPYAALICVGNLHCPSANFGHLFLQRTLVSGSRIEVGGTWSFALLICGCSLVGPLFVSRVLAAGVLICKGTISDHRGRQQARSRERDTPPDVDDKMDVCSIDIKIPKYPLMGNLMMQGGCV